MALSASKRSVTACHLVENDAQRENIAANVDVLLPSICSGDMYGAVPRIVPSRVRGVVSSSDEADGSARRMLGEAEVENLDRGHPHGDHDVARLQVTMGDAFVVSSAEPFRESNGDRRGTRRSSMPSPGIHVHRAFCPSTNSIVRKCTSSGLFDRVDGDDVGVVQCGHGFRFALEARQPFRLSAAISVGSTLSATFRSSFVSFGRDRLRPYLLCPAIPSTS